jgi:hypothetical protein
MLFHLFGKILNTLSVLCKTFQALGKAGANPSEELYGALLLVSEMISQKQCEIKCLQFN